MRKNLIQQEVRNELLTRVNSLTPGSQKQWGKMNVNQMLRHTHDGLLMAYGTIKSAPKGNAVSKALMRFIIFNTDMATPKEKADTFPELNMVENNINPENFEEEKAKLIEIIKNFPQGETYHTSALLGKMTTHNWGRLNYTHLHHHFNQFGV